MKTTITTDAFQKWAIMADEPLFIKDLKQAVIYTRVSTKEQQDTNLSLEFQKKTIIDYAKRNDFGIIEEFGGQFESAKTDGRKEFNRMLNFIKSKKGAISHILVYTTSRFSRTGGAAIKLAEDLRVKCGVQVLAVTQPTDTTTASGQFQQNIQFLFAQWDNQQRKQATSAGTKEKLESGIWCLRPPMGYDAIKINGIRTIVINKDGEHIRQGFKWKLLGLKNEDILERLRALGVTIYKQKLSQIFSNPFYCGIIVTSILNGKVVKGTHPAMISEDEFLQINEMRAAAGGKFGIPHQKEIGILPLKVFVKCEKCSNSYTGYVVKAKQIYYYKCQTTGCKCNQNANRMNGQFVDFLDQYSLREELISPLMSYMSKIFNNRNETSLRQIVELQKNLDTVQRSIDNLEDSFFAKRNMSEETYMKLKLKYAEEKTQILKSISRSQINKSNLEQYLENAVIISRELPTVWDFSPVPQKEILQKLVFPQGVYYNLENEAYRTEKTNEAFSLCSDLNRVWKENKKRQDSINAILSSQVAPPGFEPRQTVPKTVVLPLYYRAPYNWMAKLVIFPNPQKKLLKN